MHDGEVFTGGERALLRELHWDVGQLLAAPLRAVAAWQAENRSGGGGGFSFEFGRTRVDGRWYEWTPVEYWPDARPRRWRRGLLLREVSITYTRLQRWVEAQPGEVRDKALTWWRTYPDNTRDLDALARLALAQLADPEPADLLEQADACWATGTEPKTTRSRADE
ncbi:hypothetical protein AB0C34_17605 [Nocardia sp. NPDC049220]|uniref:hypothetical protein n=1 Tax=Nocardia sp. NPDC049220 TaxID=3155273 RepID=UPI0033C7B74F